MASKLLQLRVFSQPQILKPNVVKNSKSMASDKAWPPKAMAEKFVQYQRADGVPVYLKGGFMDKILLMVTASLNAIGVVYGLSTILPMAFRRK